MMSNPSPPPLRRRGLRVVIIWAGGVMAAAALAGVLGYFLSDKIPGALHDLYDRSRSTISMMFGWPHFEGCRSELVREEVLDQHWYRIVRSPCDDGRELHYVFMRAADGWLVMPAFLSNRSPVPVALRRTGERTFEIVLASPLSDGTERLTVTLDGTNYPTLVHFFLDGERRDFGRL